eukprot:1142194-Pelagomonas_calceolata.AAC.6
MVRGAWGHVGRRRRCSREGAEHLRWLSGVGGGAGRWCSRQQCRCGCGWCHGRLQAMRWGGTGGTFAWPRASKAKGECIRVCGVASLKRGPERALQQCLLLSMFCRLCACGRAGRDVRATRLPPSCSMPALQ